MLTEFLWDVWRWPWNAAFHCLWRSATHSRSPFCFPTSRIVHVFFQQKTSSAWRFQKWWCQELCLQNLKRHFFSWSSTVYGFPFTPASSRSQCSILWEIWKCSYVLSSFLFSTWFECDSINTINIVWISHIFRKGIHFRVLGATFGPRNRYQRILADHAASRATGGANQYVDMCCVFTCFHTRRCLQWLMYHVYHTCFAMSCLFYCDTWEVKISLCTVLWWLHSSTHISMRCRNRLNLTFQKAPRFLQFSNSDWEIDRVVAPSRSWSPQVWTLRQAEDPVIQARNEGIHMGFHGISHGISHSQNAKGQPKQKKPVEAAADWTVLICIVLWFLFVPVCTASSVAFFGKFTLWRILRFFLLHLLSCLLYRITLHELIWIKNPHMAWKKRREAAFDRSGDGSTAPFRSHLLGQAKCLGDWCRVRVPCSCRMLPCTLKLSSEMRYAFGNHRRDWGDCDE